MKMAKTESIWMQAGSDSKIFLELIPFHGLSKTPFKNSQKDDRGLKMQKTQEP